MQVSEKGILELNCSNDICHDASAHAVHSRKFCKWKEGLFLFCLLFIVMKALSKY